MKPTFAAVCFLATVVCTIALLPEKICRAPHPKQPCDAGTPRKWLFYFNNGTDRCTKYKGCGKGMNDFGAIACCRDSCPYGQHKPKRADKPKSPKTSTPTLPSFGNHHRPLSRAKQNHIRHMSGLLSVFL
ncbi:uncharacterized protein LOC8053632 [Ixodes scapularis]|uniref:uncharacterized protein LOC8053632 n=1 Tax=Ixodes scapularis TaxID=6945 RepID=UPI001A9DD2AB|nr:uncharacterized protein LOC8053632 [Ixodes scapularis]